jgi:hypothetical protein
MRLILGVLISNYMFFRIEVLNRDTIVFSTTFCEELGLKFKNFIIPTAIGIACWFAGTILVKD